MVMTTIVLMRQIKPRLLAFAAYKKSWLDDELGGSISGIYFYGSKFKLMISIVPPNISKRQKHGFGKSSQP